MNTWSAADPLSFVLYSIYRLVQSLLGFIPLRSTPISGKHNSPVYRRPWPIFPAPRSTLPAVKTTESSPQLENMSSVMPPEWASGMGNQKLLDKVDALRELNIDVPLPQVNPRELLPLKGPYISLSY